MKVTVNAVRSGGWWAIDVPEVKGARSQARRLDQVEKLAAEAVATVLDIEPEDVTVIEVVPVLDELDEVKRATEAARAAKEAQAEAAKHSARAVNKLLAAGLPMRDVGSLLKVSPQRVSQISKTMQQVDKHSKAIKEINKRGKAAARIMKRGEAAQRALQAGKSAGKTKGASARQDADT